MPGRRRLALARGEQADLVLYRRIAQLHDPNPRVDHAGKRQRPVKAAARFHHEAHHRSLADIETAIANEVLVDHRVEVGIVDDVVDVAVAVVVQPASRDRQKMAKVSAAQCRRHVDQRVPARDRRRPSNTSIQCRTGSWVPLGKMRETADVGRDDARRGRPLRARPACSPSAAATDSAAESNTCRPSRNTGARRGRRSVRARWPRGFPRLCHRVAAHAAASTATGTRRAVAHDPSRPTAQSASILRR